MSCHVPDDHLYMDQQNTCFSYFTISEKFLGSLTFSTSFSMAAPYIENCLLRFSRAEALQKLIFSKQTGQQ